MEWLQASWITHHLVGKDEEIEYLKLEGRGWFVCGTIGGRSVEEKEPEVSGEVGAFWEERLWR